MAGSGSGFCIAKEKEESWQMTRVWEKQCRFLAGLFNSRLIKRALVVAPKNLLPHWVNELSVVGLSEKTREYHGTWKKAREEGLYCIHQDGGVLVTTYGVIVRDYSKLFIEHKHLRSYDKKIQDSPTWDYSILDEVGSDI